MRNYFILDGVDSREFGVYLSGQGTFGAPSKAYTYHDVPGRNGALIGSEKRFNNIEVTYPAFIYANFKQNISDFRNFLLSRDGYVRLEDTYNRDEYRLVSYAGAFEPEVTKKNDAGSFNIVFNCMPQRFLLSGEIPITGTAVIQQTIVNPTQFPSNPLIKFNGTTGSFYVGDYRVDLQIYVSGISSVYLDCETMEAYSGSTNLNQYVSIYKDGSYANDYPVLVPGNTVMRRSGNETFSWEVTPRWWKL